MKYKWFFDESGVLTECAPKLDNETKLEFAPESGEMFYRAKLTNALTFQIEFDDILSKGYSHTHVVVLHRFDDSENDFVEVWRGKFTLTDCTINYDRKTIEVTPATIDRYTDVMAALETDYNIVKLAPEMQAVNILIRPLTQVYLLGSTKISNYVGGNSWDSTCNVPEYNDMDSVYHFVEMRNTIWFELKYKTGPNAGKHCVYYGVFPNRGMWQFPVYGKIYNSDGTYTTDNSLTCLVYQDVFNWVFNVTTLDQSERILTAQYSPLATGSEWNDLSEGGNVEDATFNWDVIFGRTLCNTDLSDITIDGNTFNFYDVATNDFAGGNNNYTKVLPYASIDINASIKTSPNPTTWPQDNFGAYFVKPDNTPTQHYYASAPELWRAVAYWWYYTAQADAVFPQLISNQTIKDCYDIRHTILKLLQKAGWNGQYVISGVFGSQGYVGNNLLPIITPKSNVISSYYDTPAQNAPISLAKIFSMLKQAYKVYWHIDENNNLHLEHISYYQNGYSYTELPQQLVDLESDLHTRTKHSKAYGQNVVKFDKSGMPGVISFGWMDKQTVPFDGYDIKALDAYIEQGLKEENLVGDFSTDVDFVLSSPNDVSKDGFFLFALPKDGENYSNTLKLEKINITDENGDNYDVTIQNADAAFCKIHKTFWRYNMPCENLQINNGPDTALTTGRFKTQTLEFADLSMADVIGDVDNCIKLIKTQQGYGAISKLSINLNSLSTSADLVFTLMGRKYYLKGAALNGPMTITLNGEQITINVENNRFVYGYTEPINELKFAGTDVVSVDFADTDTLAELTSADDMFKNCAELIAVNFGNKTFGAVTSANNMFRGCIALTTLICPDSSTWKADLDFSDCPALTLESFYDLIKFLYYYNAGVHTITPNTTFWNALDADTQNDLLTKASARGWSINIPARYSVTGESTSSTVYATINGTAVEIPVTGGVWQYNYNAPITSISFENDSNLTKVDFSLSDGLAGLTTLADAFKNCSALTSVDFSNCDLSNVASATDTFAGCTSLTELIVPSGTWKPDVDLSDTAMVYADMLSTIGMLYTYATGTHTITFNQTTWDSFTQAQQQTISDAASAKGWQTNAVGDYAYIRGTSTAATEQMTFNFIDLATQAPNSETLNIPVVNGSFEYRYKANEKAIYSLGFATFSNTLRSIEFTEDFAHCVQLRHAFQNKYITSASFPNATFENVTESYRMFYNCTSLTSVSMPSATFERLVNAGGMFDGCTALPSVDLSHCNFQSLEIVGDRVQNFYMFSGCTALESVDFGANTFPNLKQSVAWFLNCSSLTSVTWGSPTFNQLITFDFAFANCISLQNAPNLSAATFENVQDLRGTFRSTKIVTLNMPLATFASVRNNLEGTYSDTHGTFYDCQQLTTINMPLATFASVINKRNMFYNNIALTTLNVPSSSTMPSTSASAIERNTDLRYSPLTYQSMLNVANWLTDFTGYGAPTCTFKTSAWNALSSAEQATIQGILQSKNWNLATA